MQADTSTSSITLGAVRSFQLPQTANNLAESLENRGVHILALRRIGMDDICDDPGLRGRNFNRQRAREIIYLHNSQGNRRGAVRSPPLMTWDQAKPSSRTFVALLPGTAVSAATWRRHLLVGKIFASHEFSWGWVLSGGGGITIGEINWNEIAFYLKSAKSKTARRDANANEIICRTAGARRSKHVIKPNTSIAYPVDFTDCDTAPPLGVVDLLKLPQKVGLKLRAVMNSSRSSRVATYDVSFKRESRPRPASDIIRDTAPETSGDLIQAGLSVQRSTAVETDSGVSQHTNNHRF
ncbi:hypothetical protein B0H14DRAFT_2610564 [Mycena olivaceomarginata]|nr:hypothetical protein B0H14DRAFT_2610564 [Mycena olivaceomarginata]